MQTIRISREKAPYPEIIWGRPLNYYNFTDGGLLLVAGSQKHTEPALITSEAIYRAGVGKITVAHPESITTFYKDLIPKENLLSVTSNFSGSLGKNSGHDILEAAKSSKTLVIGPGISKNPETLDLCRELFRSLDGTGKIIIVCDFALLPALEYLKEKSDCSHFIFIIQEKDIKLLRKEFQNMILKTGDDDFLSEFSRSNNTNLVCLGSGLRIFLPDGNKIQTFEVGSLKGKDALHITTGIVAAFSMFDKKDLKRILATAAYVSALLFDKNNVNPHHINLFYRKALKDIPRIISELEN